MDWMESGACRDYPPNMFYPSDGAGVVSAQRVCARCPVRGECLEYALTHRINHGVWGGTSERQRLRLGSERRSGLKAMQEFRLFTPDQIDSSSEAS